MALAAARRTEQQQVGAVVEPGIAGGERHDLRLADDRHGLEVEGVEALAGRQPGLGEMAFQAAAVALGHLVLDQCRQEAGRRPTLLVGLRGERRPHLLDGGEPHLGKEQLDTRDVDGIGGLHGAASLWSSAVTAAGLPSSS